MQWKTGQQAGAGQCATWGWVMGDLWIWGTYWPLGVEE